jgi:NifU-like protein involved in Fe-S cluster formation
MVQTNLNYTKELTKRFRNPKFVKKLKNPNAVGEVGNIRCGDIMRLELEIKDNKIKDIGFQTYGCLPPKEEVLIKEGDWVDVSLVNIGESVLNGGGRKTKVIENYVRDYKGDLITITPFVSTFNSISLTPEHPILCIKRKWLKSARKTSSKCDWLRVNEKELLSTKPEFIKTEDAEVADYIIFVPNRRVVDSDILTEDIMKLIGYYLAEGYITANGSAINFAFNKNEIEYITEVKELLNKIIGKPAKERTRNNVTEVYICSVKWADFFIKICGKYAQHKKLSDEILILPFEKQWKMIETYIKGDDNIYIRRNGNSPTYRITTASRNLAIQIQEILARGRIFASIKKDKRIRENHYIEGRKVPYNQYYEISFKLEKRNKFYHSNGKYILVPIKKIEKKSYNDKVYNFQVNGEPHSYLVKGFAVHNCPAAIASSDVVCELAKGKTLEQAEKLTKDDIIKKLKKMPPIKIHCSVLGIEALKKAIKDYEKKTKK